jgi:hypothetical protein
MVYASRRSLCLLLILLALAIGNLQAQSFVHTGNMMLPRIGHSATLLQDGRVLVAGGNIIEFFGPSDGYRLHATSTAEIYDPATGTFSETGAMTAARAGHVAVLLQDGRVLLVGGSSPTAEFYDPATGAFTSAGHMSVAQGVDSAILLKNGKLLVIGTDTREVFDPATGAFTPLNSGGIIADPYDYDVTMSLLSDGQVLLASGLGLSLYDPGSDGFRQLPIGWHIEATTATPLLDGSVFLAGGYTGPYGTNSSLHTYVYDPATQTLKTTADMQLHRVNHTATLLRDGRVLIAGGSNSYDGLVLFDDGVFSEAELYDPATGTLAGTRGMAWGREAHAATLLRDGRVLITGGRTTVPGSWQLTHPQVSTAELFIPESTQGSVPQLELNSTRYCVGDTWTLRADSIAPLTSVQISGTRDGSPWTISDWQTSGPDGTLVATGTYGTDAVGHYTLWLYAGGKTSSSISVTIENCSVHLDLTNSKSGNPQTDFYIGDSWTAHVTGSMPGANVKLLGISNGTPWTIESWGRTGSDGSFTTTGTFPPGSDGNHALRVVLGAAQSNEVRFRVIDY